MAKKNILEMFGLDTTPIMGLDISSSAIKLLELTKHGDQIRVERYAMEPLEPGIVVERNIINKERVIAAIKALIEKNKIHGKKVSVSIPNSACITKTIKMNAELNDKEIGSEIELEAEKYIPYPLDEVNMDYTVVGPSDKDEGMVDVLLVASKVENADNLEEVLLAAGLVPAIIDVDSFAIAGAFDIVINNLPAQARSKVLAIFDIGATTTTLNVFNNKKHIYTREQSFGGQQLIDEIQHRYGLTYEEAIVAFQFQELPDDYTMEILEPFKQSVAQQVNRFCQYFFSSGDFSAIDYVFLTGGVSAITGIENLIQNKIQTKTFIANPFADFVIPRHINADTFKRDIPRLMMCCGLALRNITQK